MDRIEQGLVFQIANENMFFVFGQIGVVDTVARHIDFFGTPEERQLFFDQFFKYFVFLLVITGNIYRLTKNIGSFRASFLVLEKVLYDIVRCSQDMAVFSD